jgi:hypothetical protein
MTSEKQRLMESWGRTRTSRHENRFIPSSSPRSQCCYDLQHNSRKRKWLTYQWGGLGGLIIAGRSFCYLYNKAMLMLMLLHVLSRNAPVIFRFSDIRQVESASIIFLTCMTIVSLVLTLQGHSDPMGWSLSKLKREIPKEGNTLLQVATYRIKTFNSRYPFSNYFQNRYQLQSCSECGILKPCRLWWKSRIWHNRWQTLK